MGKLATLKELATKAGRWLGLGSRAEAVAQQHTGAIVADRFDEMSWRETYDQAPALAELADDLAERYDYASDLLRDVWTAAYKTAPEVRPREQMDPSRAVNHQVIASMVETPEFAALHRETAGDPYAAAMAVLSQAAPLRRMLEQTRNAQQAAQAQADAAEQAAQAAAEVQAAMEAAAAAQAGQQDSDGEEAGVPAHEQAALEQAIAAAEQADARAEQATEAASAALTQSGATIRAAIRAAAADAAEQAAEEAALMASWGVQPGQLARMSFETRARLAERLRGGRLGRFAELIGRFRTMARGERARKTEHAVGELVGVTLGDDISRAIPSELAQLGVPALRPVFAAKLAEGRLMTYETRGDDRAGQGAIIAVVDCSYSMIKHHNGISREAWAKAISLALLDQARESKRAFAGILFSSEDEQQLFRFPADRPAAIGDVLDFTECFFGGGTDFMPPLDLAAELLAAEYNAAGSQRGDIVFITDGECNVTEEWMRAWQERKATLGFRVFGIAVGEEPGPVLEALADNLRTVTDLADVDQARDMFRVI